MKRKIIFISLVVIIMVGCNTNTDDNVRSAYDQNENQITRITTIEMNSRSGEFTNDVTSGLSNENPNYVGITGTSGGQKNYTNDIEKAREVVSLMDRYEVGQIWVKGGHMRVIAYFDGNLTSRQQVEAEVDLRSHLLAALPRYTIDITIREERQK
jgi:hypothetical protein